MPQTLLFGGRDFLGDRVQDHLPDVFVVRCFNTVSVSRMITPNFEEPMSAMTICGDNATAKERVETIVPDLGWPGALDVGDVTASRYLEGLVPL